MVRSRLSSSSSLHLAALLRSAVLYFFFFFSNDTATTEIYTLSLHDALPIWPCAPGALSHRSRERAKVRHAAHLRSPSLDRKSTRLNSSHLGISYAVFCLKKKKKKILQHLKNT